MSVKKSKISYVFRNKLTLVQDSTNLIVKKITSSKDAYKYCVENIYDKGTIDLFEEFNILHLNRGNEIIGISKVSSGGYSGTVADGKMIFSLALKHTNTSGIILVHNHPSGQLKPSEEDLKLTKNLVEFGKMIGMPIMDHIIVTSKYYYSFVDEGQL